MKIEFDVQSTEGPIAFKGELSTQEVQVLLEFAIVTMLQRGYLTMEGPQEETEAPLKPSTVN